MFEIGAIFFGLPGIVYGLTQLVCLNRVRAIAIILYHQNALFHLLLQMVI